MKTQTLKQKLEEIKASGNFSQVQIARLAKMKQGHISKIIRGVYEEENISQKTAKKINALYSKLCEVKS